MYDDFQQYVVFMFIILSQSIIHYNIVNTRIHQSFHYYNIIGRFLYTYTYTYLTKINLRETINVYCFYSGVCGLILSMSDVTS